MEKTSDDLDTKLNNILSTVNQINNFNINFSPTHSTASQEYESEDDTNIDSGEETDANVNIDQSKENTSIQ